MPFINPFWLLVVFFCCFHIFNQSRADNPTYLYHYCRSNDTALARTTLDQLLSSLSKAAQNANGFFNTTAGTARNFSLFYGLFLCRGDVPAEICQTCVGLASNDSARLCAQGRDFIIWYEECMLRYSNESFFATVQERPKFVMWMNQEVTDIDRFAQILAPMVEDTATAASSARPGAKKLATKQADFDVFQKLYALAECVPDLSRYDCYRCLRIATSEFSRLRGKTEVFSLYPSCNVRYQTSPFYNQLKPPPSPPPLELSAPPRRPPAGKGSRTAVYIVAPVVGSLVLLFSLFYFIYRWRSKLRKKDGIDGAIQSLQFDLATIRSATGNFADTNKIGMGGFGSVYKVDE